MLKTQLSKGQKKDKIQYPLLRETANQEYKEPLQPVGWRWPTNAMSVWKAEHILLLFIVPQNKLQQIST